MATSLTDADAFDITVRVGCSLTYEVTGPATLLLNMKPRPDRRHVVLEESLVLGTNLRTDVFDDSHGNRMHRLSLPAGRHEMRHDAIIRVYSQPDNHDLMNTAPLPAGRPAAGGAALHAAEPVLRLGQAGPVRVG